ncbi:MAG: DUF951 domain-containing protein [Chloroflexi bacterium]|nr:DUF951 domain-containing protein [Chloroflexota bacterium]
MASPLELRFGDVIRLRRPHPCGGYDWRLVRLGADIGLRCCRCNHRILLSRRQVEKQMKGVVSEGEPDAAY